MLGTFPSWQHLIKCCQGLHDASPAERTVLRPFRPKSLNASFSDGFVFGTCFLRWLEDAITGVPLALRELCRAGVRPIACVGVKNMYIFGYSMSNVIRRRIKANLLNT